jgi:Glycosyltransferases involved in cell wall biogenesis
VKTHENRYFIKDGYQSQEKCQYFEDFIADANGVVHQPDVYPFVGYLARKFGSQNIVDLGCGRAQKLVALQPEFQTVGVDYGVNIRYCRSHYDSGRWVEWNLENPRPIPLNKSLIRGSVVVCSDVIEHLVEPVTLLKNLRSWLNNASIAVLTTPERDRVRGPEDWGPPANPSHVREWSLVELEHLVQSIGFNILFSGLTTNNSKDLEKKTSLLVLAGDSVPELVRAPDRFRVVAIMTAYNEEDIIVPAISRLIQQGIEVYLIDNWSTDATCEKASTFLDRGLIAIEKFPVDGPPQHYEWGRLLRRVEEVAEQISADWFIHHDVDEIRESPWSGTSLRDGLYRVDRSGFNAIDHTVLVFPPADNGYVPGTDFGRYFVHFAFGQRLGHFSQVKAWKNLKRPVHLKNSGGHEVEFDGRRVYPFKFLLKHYPIRSQAHGVRKVFAERVARFSPGEKAMGWHHQYDQLDRGENFLRQPPDVEVFDESTFLTHYLVERLSGVGINR